MNRTTTAQDEDAAMVTAAFGDLMVLIEELVAIVEEENQVLACGLPASLSRFTARKNELADRLETWVAAIAAGRVSPWSGEAGRRERFLAAVGRLHKGMDENVERLRAAIDASRRRIDAVMQAIRAEFRTAAPYGSDGRVASPPTSPVHGGAGVCV